MTTPNSLRAIAHPLRLQILSLLTGSELSAAEVARELGTTQANASYHLRVLAAAGMVVPAGEEKIRGGMAKRYRHPWRTEERPDAYMPTSRLEHEQFIQAIAQELLRRTSQRIDGTAQFVDAELWVAKETWDRTVLAFREASIALHAAAQPPRTDETVRVNVTCALFMLGDGELGSAE